MPDVSAVQHDSLAALEAEILRVGPDRVAAFFCEPVIGAGGVRLPPDGYIEGVADLCAEHDVLLVVDSVICGFGRLGTWFGIERWEDVRPDLITFAKGITSGYLPLGGVIASGRVAAPFFEEPGGPMLRHGATYAGHPTCCAAGLAVLDIYERENIIPRGRELERPLRRRAGAAGVASRGRRGARRARAAGRGPAGAGRARERPAALAKVAGGAREAGVIVRPLLGSLASRRRSWSSPSTSSRSPKRFRAGLDRLRLTGTPTSTPSCARGRRGYGGDGRARSRPSCARLLDSPPEGVARGRGRDPATAGR